MNRTTIGRDEFDTLLVSELKTLREGEYRLKRLYSQLRRRPQLREVFLGELAAVQSRAERLYAVLSPCELLAPAVLSTPNLRPAA